MTLDEMRAAISEASAPGFTFGIYESDDGGAFYLQGCYTATDITTGVDELQTTRKWLLSQHMTKSELVQTVFKCYLTSVEHQAREKFTYRGKRIFGPHFNVDSLHAICTDRNLDYRRALCTGDVLIVVDVQNDFVTGSLAVHGAAEILPAVDSIVRKFNDAGLPIFISQCWHPHDHCSFIAQGGPWPSHCVQGTAGAALAFDHGACGVLVRKGTRSGRDDYSALDGYCADDGRGLNERLEGLSTKRIFVCGIATDYCVKATVLHARELDFPVVLLIDAIAAVERIGGVAACTEMYQANVIARMSTHI